MWVRFVETKPIDKPGISVLFNDTPTYNIGYCMRYVRFTMPGTGKEKYRIWTIKKQDKTLQLLCNGVDIFNVSYAKISERCKKRWSRDFAAMIFGNKINLTDTASEFYRPYSDGMCHFNTLLFHLL